MTDDDILSLMEVGKEYTREEVEALTFADTREEKTFVVRALGRLKRWGKVVTSDDGLYQATGSTTAQKPTAELKVTKKKDPFALQYSKKQQATEKPVGLPLKEALLKTQAIIKGRGVDELEDKLYVLKFLGQLLDPTIDNVFKSISEDLKRLHGSQSN